MTGALKLRLAIAVAACAIGVAALAVSSEVVSRAARARTYSDVRAIPHRHVGLVLGCSKQAGPWRNLYFDHRIRAAAQLFQAGKVDYLLVSGDNHTREYDESTDMKDSLVQAGVPADRIYCDYAGFRTLDSVVRAREVFGQTRITIVSQEFHNQRAIFIARRRGLDAIGFNAAEVDPSMGFRTRCRERVAKVYTILDLFVFQTRPKFLGPRVPIPD